MKTKSLMLLIVSLFFSGCAIGPTPQNADEYRKTVAKSDKSSMFGAHKDTYTVKRSYRSSVKLIKKKMNKCLRRTIKQEVCGSGPGGYGYSCTTTVFKYKPTLIRGKKMTTLQMQMAPEKDNSLYLGGKPPRGGMIIGVFDLIPKSRKRTIVNSYAPNNAYEKITKAVKHWLKGTNQGCPNITGGTG